MTRLLDLRAASHAAAWGVSHARLLTLSDPVELMIERQVVAQAIDIRIANEEALATHIGNAVAKALS